MHPHRRRSAVLLPAILAAAALVTAGAPVSSADPVPPPSVRLLTASSHATLHRYGGRWVPLHELGVYVASVGGDFELRVVRPDYDTPAALAQVDSTTGEMLRDLPDRLLDGWFGLRKFSRVSFRSADGDLVARRDFGFCPNGWDRQRVDDTGPATPRYPVFCASGSPFLRGMVWGIDRGWAVGALGGSDEFGEGGGAMRVRDGTYTVRVVITRRWASLLGLAPEQRGVTLQVTVKTQRDRFVRPLSTPEEEAASPDPKEGVPTVTEPDPSTVPDLAALPAWSIEVTNRRGRDYLAFAATPWNAGPAPLVVEGFRRSGEDVMDAYQYFYDEDGQAVGRAPVGTMEYDRRRGHHHWHFELFAAFDLIDASDQIVVRSRKQSFCIVPTDAIDLAAAGANWNPWSFGLGSACGSQAAIWVREELDAGWGDTYFQYAAGQAFNITNVPNGTYSIAVRVDPLGSLHQATTDNDVEHRVVHLGGVAGARTVTVEPWHGIEA